MKCNFCTAIFNNMEIGWAHEAACKNNPDNIGLTDEDLYFKAQKRRFRREKWADGQGVARKKALIEFFFDHVEKSKIEKALILGAADPTVKHILEGANIGAVIATDLNAHHPEIVKMDMHEIDFSENTFDLVVASHSLEHAFDPGKVISEIYRVLRPGGFFLCEVPVHYPVNDVDRHDFGSGSGLMDFVSEHGNFVPGISLDIPHGFPGNFCAGDVVKMIAEARK